jgi:RHS repeat-associated protein
VWDGNTPLHEWTYEEKDRPKTLTDKYGLKYTEGTEPTENITTWVFEEGSFRPAAKLTEDKKYSIITDYLGTPVQMYDEKGQTVWETRLDIYGKVHTFVGRSLSDCPFRYQGQYEDSETGLYYNRFRYYSPEEGMYLSQDLIGLAGGSSTLYKYVNDVNYWVDIMGLKPVKEGDVGAFGSLAGEVGDELTAHHMPQDALGFLPKNEGGAIVINQTEHTKTRTYAGKGATTKITDSGRPFKDVLTDDIVDLRKISGGKYDNSIKKLINYYEEKGLLKKGELSMDSIIIKCN